MATFIINVRRGPRGKHRGAGFLVVFPVGSTTPVRRVKVTHITQAPVPDDPLPIIEAKDRLWAIDFSYQQLWPRRPKRSHFPGAMRIEPIWQKVEVEPRVCQPAVGFLLHYRGQTRYQQHTLLKTKAACVNLRHTGTKTYWAKRDLGAVMMRFETSEPGVGEQSIRFPISAAWDLAKAVRLRLETSWPRGAAERRALVKTLRRYGALTVRHRPQADFAPRPQIGHSESVAALARNLAHEVGGRVVGQEVPDDVDLWVRAGP